MVAGGAAAAGHELCCDDDIKLPKLPKSLKEINLYSISLSWYEDFDVITLKEEKLEKFIQDYNNTLKN